jgi:hypothetical protein
VKAVGRNNDEECVHEQLLLDFAAGVNLLREQGAEAVVLVGSSGGSSLAAFYQAQATAPRGERLTHTPAGHVFDLNSYSLPPGNGLVLIGEHVGEGALMLKWLDPSVTDESDPRSCDDSLDMYNFENGFRIPPAASRYSEEFITKYREAQVARSHRLDGIARQRIREREASRDLADDLANRGEYGPEWQRHSRRAASLDQMQIFRVQADLHMVDHSLDPDDRDFEPPRPDLVNYGSSFARYLTPEAWLSTWSGTASQANTSENLAKVHQPTLIVHYCGDRFTLVAEAQRLFERSAAKDKSMVMLPKHDHHGYLILGNGIRSEVPSEEGKGSMLNWVQERFSVNS